jgi:hypothetical protein
VKLKCVIAGSRYIEDYSLLEQAIKDSGIESMISEVVSGCCPSGVDQLGEQWAIKHNIPIKKFPADWKSQGRAAGPIRNKQMAEHSDFAIIVCYGDSKGSNNMIKEMKVLNKPTYIKVIEKDE